jgi:hypothetical protein
MKKTKSTSVSKGKMTKQPKPRPVIIRVKALTDYVKTAFL